MKRLILIPAIALLAGCGSDHADLRQRIEEVKTRPAPPIDPLPTIRTPETYVYSVHDLRDPFGGGDTVGGDEGPGDALLDYDGPIPDFNRRREALESFPIDSLTMSGTLAIGGENYALITDPDGLLHRVTEGNYLGQNHGQITAIYEDHVEILEIVPDGENRWREERQAIKLAGIEE